MAADLNQLGETIAHALPGAVKSAVVALGELTLDVEPADIVKVIAYLRDDPACEFKLLVDICGADWPQRAKRFDVVYHLLSLSKNARIRVKAQLSEHESIASIVPLHPSANWFERETYDMYGIAFD